MTDVVASESQDAVTTWESMTLDERLDVIHKTFEPKRISLTTDEFLILLNESIVEFSSQLLVSQDKAVDVLLDVYNYLRERSGPADLATDFIREIIHLSAVRGVDISHDLGILVATIGQLD